MADFFKTANTGKRCTDKPRFGFRPESEHFDIARAFRIPPDATDDFFSKRQASREWAHSFSNHLSDPEALISELRLNESFALKKWFV